MDAKARSARQKCFMQEKRQIWTTWSRECCMKVQGRRDARQRESSCRQIRLDRYSQTSREMPGRNSETRKLRSGRQSSPTRCRVELTRNPSKARSLERRHLDYTN